MPINKYSHTVRPQLVREDVASMAKIAAESLIERLIDWGVDTVFGLPGDGNAIIDTARAVIGEFFGQYLQGKPSELIEKGSAKYPLAKIETPH